MFTMTYTSKRNNRDLNITMDIGNDNSTLEHMFVSFMSMMRMIGYQDRSWDIVIDHIKEWRDEYGDNWVSEYICEL